MKSLFHHPFLIYLAAGMACLCIMTIVDYLLGAEAEFLNAWVILKRLIGLKTDTGNSLAIRHLGLAGATLVMLAANTLFGVILIQVIRLIIRLVHS